MDYKRSIPDSLLVEIGTAFGVVQQEDETVGETKIRLKKAMDRHLERPYWQWKKHKIANEQTQGTILTEIE